MPIALRGIPLALQVMPLALQVVPPVLQVMTLALQVSVFGWDLGHCRPLEPHNALQVPPKNKDLQQ